MSPLFLFLTITVSEETVGVCIGVTHTDRSLIYEDEATSSGDMRGLVNRMNHISAHDDIETPHSKFVVFKWSR